MLEAFTVIIIDDEIDSRNAINELFCAEDISFKVVSECQNAQSGLEAIIDYKPDIVFLDIQMPEKDGFWLADKLRKTKIKTEIIFVTAYNEFAIEAFKYSAFDFLTKPIDTKKFNAIIDRFIAATTKIKLSSKLDSLNYFINRPKLRFNNNDGFVLIAPDEIVFCAAEGNYSNIVLQSGERELVTIQLGKIEIILADTRFLRISRSTLINTDYLSAYRKSKREVSLIADKNEYCIQTSFSGRKKLLKL